MALPQTGLSRVCVPGHSFTGDLLASRFVTDNPRINHDAAFASNKEDTAGNIFSYSGSQIRP